MQNLLTVSLKAISDSDFFTEKIIICPSFGEGNKILESFTWAKNCWINYRVSTIQSLAADLAQEEICKRNLEKISTTATLFLIDRIFTESSKSGELKYFKKHTINSGIINALSASLMELKFAGIANSQLEDRYFIDKNKAHDLRLIFAKYEAGLKEKSLIDIADIVVLAASVLPKSSASKKYITLARYGYKKIEKDFLTACCGNDLVVICEEKVLNLPQPINRLTPGKNMNNSSTTSTPPISEFAVNKFSYLFNLDSLPEGSAGLLSKPGNTGAVREAGVFKSGTTDSVDMELFCAQNYRDEIYAILGRIAGSESLLDDTEIIYTCREPYLDIINNLCHRLNIPVTSSAGLQGEKSSCGKALKGFLLWINEDFPEVYLRNLFKYSLIKTDVEGAENKSRNTDKEPKINSRVFAQELRESKIGWGRQRYIPVLEKSIADIKTRMEGSKKSPKICLERISLLENLKEYVSKLLGIIPDTSNGLVDFNLFCKCCRDFLSYFVNVKDKSEASFLENFNKSLNTLGIVTGDAISVEEAAQNGKIAPVEETTQKGNAVLEEEATQRSSAVSAEEAVQKGKMISTEEAVQKIIRLIKDARFLISGPKPGSLYVSGLAGGGLSGRGNTYIVGMDDHKFPSTEIQDPILLDEEREKISSELSLSKDRMKEKLYDFTAMLAAIRGKVTFSFSVFDMNDERNLSASSVLLQLYRLKSGKSDADYNELLKYLGQPAGYGQGYKDCPPVDESYWWLDKLLAGGSLKNARQSILNIYPGLNPGTIALESRNVKKTGELTCFDGFIGSPEGIRKQKLDPRKNSSFVLSCTGIEKYAQSPFAFFLTYILKIKRPEDIKKDPTLWLDGKNKGSLLHDVYQNFTLRMISMASGSYGYPDMDKQRKIIHEILDGAIEKYKLEIPFPGEAVFNREILQLKRDTDIFLEINDTLGNPYYAEFDFGSGENDPVKISTGIDKDGRESYIYVRGRIDRVDFDIEKTSEYHVWDYKTGSSYGYEEDGFVSKGRQLQHVMYARVMEEILKSKNPNAKVTKCGYIFPTRKGMDSGKSCVLERDPHQEKLWKDVLNCILDLISAGVFIISDEDNPPYLDDDDIYGSRDDKKNIKGKIKNPVNAILEKWSLLKKFK